MQGVSKFNATHQTESDFRFCRSFDCFGFDFILKNTNNLDKDSNGSKLQGKTEREIIDFINILLAIYFVFLRGFTEIAILFTILFTI